MTKEEIGQIIKESRLAAGLTQAQVAEMLERPQQTIAGWEVGRSQPDANTLFELFAVLGRSVDEAFGYTEKKTTPLSVEAIKLARAYDALDEYGKKLVNLVISQESDRCWAAELAKGAAPESPEIKEYLDEHPGYDD